MSEQEKTSGESGNPMVVVEKTASNRNKPYRPNELQEETVPDLHKRSKAPAVPSVAEELKDITVNEASDRVDRKEIDRAMSSDKHTHVPKKLSTNKRGPSPEEIAMALVETKRDTSGMLQQPIPAKVEAVASEASSVTSGKAGNKADNDSITEEVADLRTADPAKEHSEWTQEPINSNAIKKKEISWQDSGYSNKVLLQDANTKSTTLLERKASVGPCSKPNTLYGGRSGISVCVPKKSIRSMKEELNTMQSVINFNVTMKLDSTSALHADNQNQKKTPRKSEIQKQKSFKKLEKELKLEEPQPKFLETLRRKIDNMSLKIRNYLNV